MTKLYI